MDRPAEQEVELYRGKLRDLGMHPATVASYTRRLALFLDARPEALTLGAGGLRAAVDDYVAGLAPGDGLYVAHAALGKWLDAVRGLPPRNVRMSPCDYPVVGAACAESIGAFRRLLEGDGLTPEVVAAHCSVASRFLGWLFPDGSFDEAALGHDAAVGYLAAELSGLKPGTRKVYAGRLRRYLEFAGPGDLPPFAPSCWGASPLPSMASEADVAAMTGPDPSLPGAARSAAAVALMANLGLRCCEVAALAIDDVDFRRATVTVAAAKGEDARVVPLDARTGELLADYIVGSRPRSSSRALFLHERGGKAGEPMTPSQVRGSLRSHAARCGVRGFGTHMLRRRAATRLVAAGVEPKVVADFLGHAEVQTTKVYLRLDIEGLRCVSGRWPDGRGE